MAKRMLADVLWEAANKWLSPETYDGLREVYSCNAALRAEIGEPAWRATGCFSHLRELPGQKFLAALGCNPKSDGIPRPLCGFQGSELQGVRYMWLLLAMHVAEDEGIEVEV